ncbi:MAG: hypothetical protein AAF960_19635 [Bacteroidota bacterium]
MNNDKFTNLGVQLVSYCKKFNIPLEYLFEILEDQKVTPMIRGKAMEYNVYLVLEQYLSRTVWSVQKLNLNAQTGMTDEDVSITHRRTGIILKVESKSAVRGSISDGKRTRIHKVPHFKVKCHRSRSNISLAGTSNDRYSVDSFDVIITTSENAIYQGNTVGGHLEIVHKKGIKPFLFNHYGVDNAKDLINICQSDWRFCIPSDIAEGGFIPRTPYVLLAEDPNWRPLNELEDRLLKIVKKKWNKNNQKDRRS